MSAPNVLILMADQWRGDCLSIDGHPTVQTPTLDALACAGTRYSRAYSANPTCIPARASLLTGQECSTHGFVGFDAQTPWHFDRAATMAGAFRAAGYQTQAVGKMHVMPERNRMGFDNVVLHSALGIIRSARKRGVEYGDVDDYHTWLHERGGKGWAHDTGLDSNSNIARPWDKDEALHYSTFTTDQSIEFLRRRDTTQPFFLFTSWNAPHPPYDPPAWAFEQYIDREMPDPVVGDWVEQQLAGKFQDDQHTGFVARRDRAWLQRSRAGYYAHMSHIDLQIGRILEELEHRNLRHNTWICFLSDHGEMMGEHHCYRKGFPWEGSARVPMILVGPSGSGVQRGHRSDLVVELRDVMPTLLEAVGAAIPESVDGRSFLGDAKGQRPADWRPFLHGGHPIIGQSMQWLTDGHEKYVWFSADGQEQLFDLDADPRECHNLALDPANEARVAAWRTRLVEALAGREEGFSDGGQLHVGKRPISTLAHRRAATAPV